MGLHRPSERSGRGVAMDTYVTEVATETRLEELPGLCRQPLSSSVETVGEVIPGRLRRVDADAAGSRLRWAHEQVCLPWRAHSAHTRPLRTSSTCPVCVTGSATRSASRSSAVEPTTSVDCSAGKRSAARMGIAPKSRRREDPAVRGRCRHAPTTAPTVFLPRGDVPRVCRASRTGGAVGVPSLVCPTARTNRAPRPAARPTDLRARPVGEEALQGLRVSQMQLAVRLELEQPLEQTLLPERSLERQDRCPGILASNGHARSSVLRSSPQAQSRSAAPLQRGPASQTRIPAVSHDDLEEPLGARRLQ